MILKNSSALHMKCSTRAANIMKHQNAWKYTAGSTGVYTCHHQGLSLVLYGLGTGRSLVYHKH